MIGSLEAVRSFDTDADRFPDVDPALVRQTRTSVRRLENLEH